MCKGESRKRCVGGKHVGRNRQSLKWKCSHESRGAPGLYQGQFAEYRLCTKGHLSAFALYQQKALALPCTFYAAEALGFYN
jgi:hypothetical protein